MSKSTQFLKDRVVSKFVKTIQTKQKKLVTPMQMVLLHFKVNNFLPKEIKALELFGMHGLWHTKDYIDLVKSLDIFELNKTYHNQSKKVLKNYNVNYHNTDSIQWLSETKNTYNFIVSDSPAMEQFYDNNGLPLFLTNLFTACEPGGVIIFNAFLNKTPHLNKVRDLINSSTNKSIEDISFFTRSEQIMYVAISIN